MDSAIPVGEYQKRRETVLKQLKGAVGVVLAGDGSPPLVGKWTPHQHFRYLTGLDAEPGGVILFDPSQPDPVCRITLFLKPRDPEIEDWDGRRHPIGGELRSMLGFEKVRRAWALPGFLSGAARRSKRLACLHPLSSHTAPVSQDLELLRKVAERMPGCSIEDRSDLIPQLRGVKSRAEQALIRKAIDITADALDAMLGVMRPGASEHDLHASLEAGFRAGGGSGPAYNPIVGSGKNATVLHYNQNSDTIGENDLIVVDAGAGYAGYASDITRAYPASGKFTKRQAEIYGVVLKAQLAAIKAVKPGVMMHELDRAARDIIEKAGFGDFYPHGIGHHLGLEVHDITPDGPLKPGHIVTIEPGVYLPDEGIGVRIEDDILVTPTGSRNLSARIPKTIEEVENQIANARKRARR